MSGGSSRTLQTPLQTPLRPLPDTLPDTLPTPPTLPGTLPDPSGPQIPGSRGPQILQNLQILQDLELMMALIYVLGESVRFSESG